MGSLYSRNKKLSIPSYNCIIMTAHISCFCKSIGITIAIIILKRQKGNFAVTSSSSSQQSSLKWHHLSTITRILLMRVILQLHIKCALSLEVWPCKDEILHRHRTVVVAKALNPSHQKPFSCIGDK